MLSTFEMNSLRLEIRISSIHELNINFFSFAKAEIKFSLLAVIKNRIELFEEKLAALKEEKSGIEAKLQAMGGTSVFILFFE